MGQPGRRGAARPCALAALAIGLGCAPPAAREIEVGVHRIRLAAPAGWEVLEHGQQAWVRRGELAISLSDLGPAAAPGQPNLPVAPPHEVAGQVLERSTEAARREIARGARRPIHGREWAELETWSRVSHMDRRRVAFLKHRGHLLAVAIERGPIEETAPAFETLLRTIEVLPDSTSIGARDSVPAK